VHNDVPSYSIRKATGEIIIDGTLDESDWERAAPIELIFPWWSQSRGPKDKTEAKMLWDDRHFYVSYVCKDPHISAYVSSQDGDTWKDDCVEVFIAPDPGNIQDYFGFEMNAKGIVLDYRRLPGERLQIDREWNAEGMQIAVEIEGTLNNDADRDTRWVTEVAIPFSSFPGGAPVIGDMWRLNLNRLGGETKAQFSQWSSSKTKRPNYHVPERFGEVFFEE
jgi:hypothetical protein